MTVYQTVEHCGEWYCVCWSDQSRGDHQFGSSGSGMQSDDNTEDSDTLGDGGDGDDDDGDDDDDEVLHPLANRQTSAV